MKSSEELKLSDFFTLEEGEEITQKLTIVLLWFYCRSSSSLVWLL